MAARGYGAQTDRSGPHWAGSARTFNTHQEPRTGHALHGQSSAPGATLIIAFVVIGIIAGTSASLGGVASLIAPAAALLVGAWILPRGTWTNVDGTRGVDGFWRVLAAVLLIASWAVALGAAQTGWSGTSPLWLFTLLWSALLSYRWQVLQRMPALGAASVLLTGLSAITALVGSNPVSLIEISQGAPGFASVLMVFGFTVVTSSIVDLAGNVDEMYERADMGSLAATLGGATALSMAAIVVTSTSSFAAAEVNAAQLRFLFTAITVLTLAGAALLAFGAYLARKGRVAPAAALPLLLGLVAATGGGWFAFSATGLSAVPALLFVAVATALALGTGLSLAAALVRDGHTLRRRFEKARTARSRATDPSHATGLGAAHATT